MNGYSEMPCPDHRHTHHHTHHERVLSMVQECETVCEHAVTHLLMHEDVSCRSYQLQLVRDCADICTLTAKYIARMSICAKTTANVCAYICEVCGNECLKHPDHHSQHCGRVCLDCAKECRAFAM